MQVSSLVKKTDNRLHINLVGELEDPAMASSGSLIRLPPGEEDTIPLHQLHYEVLRILSILSRFAEC